MNDTRYISTTSGAGKRAPELAERLNIQRHDALRDALRECQERICSDICSTRHVHECENATKLLTK